MTTIEQMNPELAGLGRYEYGWADRDDAGATAQREFPHRQFRREFCAEDEGPSAASIP